MTEDTCLACGQTLGLVRPVWCADCRTPHHRDCFARDGRCAVARCSGRRFSETRIGPSVNAVEVRAADGSAALRNFIVDFTSGRELAANLAIWLAAGVLVAGMLGTAARPHLARVLAGAGAALLAVAILIRRRLSDYRVIAGADRVIWLHRSFLGRTDLKREAAFAEVARVIVAYTERGARRSWRVWLEMLDHTGLGMTDAVRQDAGGEAMPPVDVLDVAQGISELVGAPVVVLKDWKPQRAR